MGILPGKPAAVVTPLTFSRVLPAPNKGGGPGGGTPTGGPTKAPDAGMTPKGSATLTRPTGQATYDLHVRRYQRKDDMQLQAVADGYVRELQQWAREISTEFSDVTAATSEDGFPAEITWWDPSSWDQVHDGLLGAIGQSFEWEWYAPLPTAKMRAFADVASGRLIAFENRLFDIFEEPTSVGEFMKIYEFARRIRKALPSLETWEHEAAAVRETVEIDEGDRQRRLHPR